MERLWNFAKRHKRKLALAGVVVGGLFYLNHYAKRRLREWQERETADCVERMRKEQHFKSTQVTCKNTVCGLIPSLQSRLIAIADCESLTDRLRNRPPDRLAIWDELKCESFTRILAAVYGTSLLTTALNVQLSVLGGYMYQDAAALTASLSGGSSSATNAHRQAPVSLSVQQRYLSLAHHFLGSGCEAMVTGLRQAVQQHIGHIPLKEGLTLSRLQQLIEAVRHHFESAFENDDDRHNDLALMSFLLPEEDEDALGGGAVAGGSNDRRYNNSDDADKFAQLMTETRDLFESDECRAVLTVTLDTAFGYLVDQVATLFLGGAEMSDEGGSSGGAVIVELPAGATSLAGEVTKVPIARLIPVMSGLSLSLLGERAEQLTARLLSLEEQKVLGANVYEAFSDGLTSNK